MELQLIEKVQPEAWDEAIAEYESRLIFHQSSWLRFLEETRLGRVVRFRILEGGSVVGYLPGLIVRKGMFTLLGTPLTGWVTDHMGPVACSNLNWEAFVGALEDSCRRHGVDFLQIGSPALTPDMMSRMGYAVTEMSIFNIPLAASKNEMWERLTGKCRNRIRKGSRNGLDVQECEGEAIVDEYHAQHVDVFARQGLTPKYPIQVVRSLFRNLKANDQLFSLRVRHQGRTIATGLFPHDDRFLYSFGIASWVQDRRLSPNELLYWTAMGLGMERGLREFCIGGNYRTPASGGNFKKKFNGQTVRLFRYAKGFSVPARLAHRVYQVYQSARKRTKPLQRAG